MFAMRQGPPLTIITIAKLKMGTRKRCVELEVMRPIAAVTTRVLQSSVGLTVLETHAAVNAIVLAEARREVRARATTPAMNAPKRSPLMRARPDIVTTL
jgi:hypothetical protein